MWEQHYTVPLKSFAVLMILSLIFGLLVLLSTKFFSFSLSLSLFLFLSFSLSLFLSFSFSFSFSLSLSLSFVVLMILSLIFGSYLIFFSSHLSSLLSSLFSLLSSLFSSPDVNWRKNLHRKNRSISKTTLKRTNHLQTRVTKPSFQKRKCRIG